MREIGWGYSNILLDRVNKKISDLAKVESSSIFPPIITTSTSTTTTTTTTP